MNERDPADEYGHEVRRAALCDVCEQRPGDRKVLAAGGIETWVCGPCVGDEPGESEEDA